ncbi:unnamed protein product [Caenorhabditis auriculariae]|uniref:Methyltransferase domain-containing protein n=1 Tax=Caenorhabditis auriculariae TaxID=2777116 RepID=A0A8S1HEJ6_9PELO|nr:unnamed protein product [Caenorhabditis auriculariae]
MSSESFPSEGYVDLKSGWIGKKHLVDPTIRLALEDGHLVVGKNVVDIGCGSGDNAKDVADLGAKRAFGFDSSEEMIRKCRETYESDERLRFEVADAVNWESDDVYDVALAFFVLQFIHEKEKLTEAIANVCRKLSRNGVFIGIIPDGRNSHDPLPGAGPKLGVELISLEKGEYIDGELAQVFFFDGENSTCHSTVALHSRQFYHDAFQAAGFRKIEWISPMFSSEGRRLLGDEFCDKFVNPPRDVLFRAFK